MTVHIPFDNTYARLPEGFFAPVLPTPVASPRILKLNRSLAAHLGLDPDALATSEGAEILAGTRIPQGAEPLAMAYAGHQFGQFVPQLGDGRAILLGEVIDRDGIRRDIQLKGSGPTPFSRRGDGRAALGPVLREYIVSEAMAALGIPTTRSLAAVATGDHVFRETILPGAVLTRVAASHIRVGTFQFFAARRNVDALRQLADYVIERHYPDAGRVPARYRALLEGVVARQADLVARWLHVGFIHGVMNTDNTSIAGETIDYGPCAFMDAYDPATVFSSIDQMGRYAYANQPGIAQWNLARLAECLLPLLSDNQEDAVAQATEAIGGFKAQFEAAHLDGMRRKLGLATSQDTDLALLRDLLDRMASNHVDFTLFFRRLADCAASSANDSGAGELFDDPAAFADWAARWRTRLTDEGQDGAARREAMRRINPAFIPRNHRIEAVIEAAVVGNLQPFEELTTVLATPFEDQPAFARYADPPRPEERVLATFCGT